MATKHLLHELLQEDQEPFLLKNFIADRRCQLQRTTHSTTFTTTTTTSRYLQVKKRKQPLPTERKLSVTQQQPEKLLKDSCFFTSNNTNNATYPVDPKHSPLLHLSNSALRTPCNSNNNCNNCKNHQNGRVVVLHVPARTAALLLEAAVRIQKPKQSSKGNNGLNVFGSLLKKLTHKSSSSSKKSGQITEDGTNVINGFSDNSTDTLWRCKSCSSRHSNEEQEEGDVGFRFVLQRNPFCSSSSSDHHTPEFSSPVASPTYQRIEVYHLQILMLLISYLTRL